MLGAAQEVGQRRDDAGPDQDRSGGRYRDEPEEPAPHLSRVVEVREGFVWGIDAQKVAQGLPALPHVVDEQAFGGNPAADLLVVAMEGLDGV